MNEIMKKTIDLIVVEIVNEIEDMTVYEIEDMTVYGDMYEYINERMYEFIDEHMYKYVYECIDGYINKCMYECMHDDDLNKCMKEKSTLKSDHQSVVHIPPIEVWNTQI